MNVSYSWLLLLLNIVVAALLGRDLMTATTQYQHDSLCARLFLENMVRQTETQSEDYKACIMAWSAPTISEYEAQQKCFTMLPTVEQLDSILRTTKASLYLKHGCFDTDSRVLLEVDRDSN